MMKFNKMTTLSLGTLILAGAFSWASIEAMDGIEREKKVKEEVKVTAAGRLAASDHRPKMDPSRFEEATRVTKTATGTLKLENLKTRKVLELNPDRTEAIGTDFQKLKYLAKDPAPETRTEARFSQELSAEDVAKFKKLGAKISQDGMTVSAKGKAVDEVFVYVSRDKNLSENAYFTLKNIKSGSEYSKYSFLSETGEYTDTRQFWEEFRKNFHPKSGWFLVAALKKNHPSVEVYAKGSRTIVLYDEGAWEKSDKNTKNYAFFDPNTKIYGTNIPSEIRAGLRAMKETQSTATVDMEWLKYNPELMDSLKALGVAYYLTERGGFGVKDVPIAQAYEIFDAFKYEDVKERGYDAEFNSSLSVNPILKTDSPLVTFYNFSGDDVSDLMKTNRE